MIKAINQVHSKVDNNSKVDNKVDNSKVLEVNNKVNKVVVVVVVVVVEANSNNLQVVNNNLDSSNHNKVKVADK